MVEATVSSDLGQCTCEAFMNIFCIVNDYLLLICVPITAFIFERVKSVNFCLFPEIDHKHTNSR